MVQVALAPGLVTEVAVAGFAALEPGEPSRWPPMPGTLALDGEREIERRGEDAATVRLGAGPLRIDVDAVMRHTARRKCNADAASGELGSA